MFKQVVIFYICLSGISNEKSINILSTLNIMLLQEIIHAHCRHFLINTDYKQKFYALALFLLSLMVIYQVE